MRWGFVLDVAILACRTLVRHASEVGMTTLIETRRIDISERRLFVFYRWLRIFGYSGFRVRMQSDGRIIAT